MALSSTKARKTAELPGRVKNTRDHLSCVDWAPGGGLWEDDQYLSLINGRLLTSLGGD